MNDQGQWVAKYVPAFVRRYPFVLQVVMKENAYAVP
ncbi:SapC family protein [Vibrio taketomensis]